MRVENSVSNRRDHPRRDVPSVVLNQMRAGGEAQAEMDADLKDYPFRTAKRPCQDCGGPVPNWRPGRWVSSRTRSAPGIVEPPR